MGRYGSLDYPKLVKGGMGTGAALFLLGVVGLTILPTYLGQVPSWEQSLFLDAEFVGVLLILLCPLVFGVILPLTE